MKLYTLNRLINWFGTYQGEQDFKEMSSLYDKLILEEQEEASNAMKEKDLVEYLDWVGDTLWVFIGKKYFSKDYDEFFIEDSSKIFNIYAKSITEFDVPEFINYTKEILLTHLNLEESKANQFLDELMNIIADSNWTKSLNKQEDGEKKGKIIKWPDFKAPTEDLKLLIKKYNLDFNFNIKD